MKRALRISAIGAVLLAAVLALIIYLLFLPLPDSPARPASGELHLVERGDRTIAYFARGEGPRVLLAASAGREVSDFNELADALVAGGYRTIAVEAPGIGESDMIGEGANLFDLAEDVMAALDDDCGNEPDCRASVIGHAFGNRVVRATAAANPNRIHGVVLIAAGGRNVIPERAAEALRNCFDPRRTFVQRREDVRYAFFAGDNAIPDFWLRGWYRHTAAMQGRASPATETDDWLAAGTGPMLVVQALGDRIAPKEDTADMLAETYPDRVSVALIEDAGHALLPEQPDAIVEAVLDFLYTIE